MSTSAINARVGWLAADIGIAEPVSPHHLRHYWTFDVFRNGTPIDKITSAGAWTNAATPLKYAKRAGIANDGVIITEEDHH